MLALRRPSAASLVCWTRSAISEVSSRKITTPSLLPEPSGAEWKRAQKVAQDVYYGREAPKLHGAMYFHSTYIKPSWAKEKKLVARIGGLAFYR